MPLAPFVVALVLAVSPSHAAPSDDAAIAREAEELFLEAARLRDNPTVAQTLRCQAARRYELLRQRGIDSAGLERNSGNAWLLAGDLPRAILAYRRGLKIAPADTTLQSSLAYARAQVVYSGAAPFARPAAEYCPAWLLHVPVHWQFFFGVAFYSLGWLLGVRWWMVRRPTLLVLAGGVFFLSAVFVADLAIDEMVLRQEVKYPLVVISEDGVVLHKGNGFSYPRRTDTPLNRGVEARLRFVRGDWLQIELASGLVGWVPRTSVLVDAR